MYNDEEEKETKIRYLTMYQVTSGDRVQIVDSSSPTMTTLVVKGNFKNYLSRKTDQVLREGKFNGGKPIYLAMEVDGKVKVFRFGDKTTATQYRKEKDVTKDVPAKVIKLLNNILKMIELEKQKLETMKKLIPATIAHYYKEAPDDGRDSGCDQEGEQTGLPEGGTEGAASPCSPQVC